MQILHRCTNAPAFVLLIVALALVAMACSGPAPEPPPPPTTAATATVPPPAADTPVPPTDTPMPATNPPTEATTGPPPPIDTPVPATKAMDSGGGEGVVFALSEGTVARYKVEEVLANTGFKVATGETTDVSGTVVFDSDGSVVADESRIAVQAATLQTDSDRRDGYVRNRTLETDTYPEVVFVTRSFDGLSAPIADVTGSMDFTITGDLTVKDQTREVTWDAMADFAADGTVSGTASVEFTFDDFGMDKPGVRVVLSVEDTIRLELDFTGTVSPR